MRATSATLRKVTGDYSSEHGRRNVRCGFSWPSEPATEDATDRCSGVEGVVVERQVGDGSLGFISSDALSV